MSHFNIYDKMPVALCHSLGLYLTPNWQICQEFSPFPLPLSFFSFIFNCVFNLRRATRLFDIRAYKNIAERHRRFTTNSQRHFSIKFSAGFLEFFFCASVFSFHLVFVRLCHPFVLTFEHINRIISTANTAVGSPHMMSI